MPMVRRPVRLCLTAAVAAYAFGSAVSGLGDFHWAAELLTHFRVQAAVVGGLLALASLALRAWTASAVAGGIAVLHLLPLLPYLVSAGRPPSTDRPSLRLLEMNVHTANRRYQAVVDVVAEKQPDLLALMEVDRSWLDSLSSLYARYPYHIAQPRSDNFGIALFSRFPIDDLRLRRLGGDGLSMVEGHFSLGSRSITLAAAHPVPPAGPGYSALRNRQLEELAAILRDAGSDEVILLGDLNTSPWSPFYQRLERETGLRNGARGLGIFPTWPVDLAPLRIPIDHCLLSSGLRVLSLETGPEIGSDHLPLLVEVALDGSRTLHHE